MYQFILSILMNKVPAAVMRRRRGWLAGFYTWVACKAAMEEAAQD